MVRKITRFLLKIAPFAVTSNIFDIRHDGTDHIYPERRTHMYYVLPQNHWVRLSKIKDSKACMARFLLACFYELIQHRIKLL